MLYLVRWTTNKTAYHGTAESTLECQSHSKQLKARYYWHLLQTIGADLSNLGIGASTKLTVKVLEDSS
jgi:hypothetical protein